MKRNGKFLCTKVLMTPLFILKMKNPSEELEILREKIQQIQDELIQNLLGYVEVYELEEDVYQNDHADKSIYQKCIGITKAIEAQEIIELVLVNGKRIMVN